MRPVRNYNGRVEWRVKITLCVFSRLCDTLLETNIGRIYSMGYFDVVGEAAVEG